MCKVRSFRNKGKNHYFWGIFSVFEQNLRLKKSNDNFQKITDQTTCFEIFFIALLILELWWFKNLFCYPLPHCSPHFYGPENSKKNSPKLLYTEICIFRRLGFKFWDFNEKVVFFQWFGHWIRYKCNKNLNFSPLRGVATLLGSLAAPLPGTPFKV